MIKWLWNLLGTLAPFATIGKFFLARQFSQTNTIKKGHNLWTYGFHLLLSPTKKYKKHIKTNAPSAFGDHPSLRWSQVRASLPRHVRRGRGLERALRKLFTKQRNEDRQPPVGWSFEGFYALQSIQKRHLFGGFWYRKGKFL